MKILHRSSSTWRFLTLILLLHVFLLSCQIHHSYARNLFSRIPLLFRPMRYDYTQQLEQKISNLQIQIRLAREETRQFRALIHKQKFEARRVSGNVAKALKDRVKEFENQVAILSTKLKELVDIEVQLRQLLKEEQNKVCDEQKDSEKKIQDVLQKAELSENQQAQIISDCKVEIEKLKKEKKDLELSLKNKLQEQRTNFDTEMKKMKDEKDDEINKVKNESDAAIQIEKVKLRKLVKAMSEREKRSSDDETIVKESSKSSKKKSSKVSTVRTGNTT